MVAALAVLMLARTSRAAGLPDDPRLAPARAELQAIVDDAERVGLPASLLVDKIREGLAKGIPAARIVGVTRTLRTAFESARSEASQHFRLAIPPGLLKAIVDAHALGAQRAEVGLV